MRAAAQHPLSVTIVALALLAIGAVFLFARPQFHPEGENSEVYIPAKPPAADASGAAGWVWPDGLPGWRVGETFDGYNVPGLQEAELRPVELSAARMGLDASDVRVFASMRPNRNGVVAILAAQTIETAHATTCLGAMLQGPAPVRWFCPGTGLPRNDLASSHVLVAAAAPRPPEAAQSEGVVNPVYAAGVARGDVTRIVLAGTGEAPEAIYARGQIWGQFTFARDLGSAEARLEIYRGSELVETVPLDLLPGEQRVLR